MFLIDKRLRNTNVNDISILLYLADGSKSDG